MTCDERIEALLNRAGQTISDLPKSYPYGQIGDAFNTAHIWNGWRGKASAYGAYILHLTDIIDRLEWALDKTLREKAYLRSKCCYICGLYEGKVRGEQSEDECEQREYCMEVYEDWREDDADI